jgi:hypothetical protein
MPFTPHSGTQIDKYIVIYKGLIWRVFYEWILIPKFYNYWKQSAIKPVKGKAYLILLRVCPQIQ